MLYIKILNTNFVTIYATISTFLLHYCQLLEKHPCHNDTDVFLMVYFFFRIVLKQCCMIVYVILNFVPMQN